MIIYESDTLKLFANSTEPSESGLIVFAFQYRRDDQATSLPGFGESFFKNHGLDAIFMNCSSNEWWQYLDLPHVLELARAHAAKWPQRVTYGSSMGGYAALRFAESLGANRCVAVGPQFSPRTEVVPNEHRFDQDIQNTKFLYENTLGASSSVENFVVYDALLKMDAQHVDLYEEHARINHVEVFSCGHPPTIVLEQCGMISNFTLSLLRGDFCKASFRQTFRAARGQSYHFWNEIMCRLLERQKWQLAINIARTALERFQSAEAAQTLLNIGQNLKNEQAIEQARSFIKDHTVVDDVSS